MKAKKNIKEPAIDAVTFLNNAREIIRTSGKALNGRSHLEESEIREIWKMASGSISKSDKFNKASLISIQEKLLERLYIACYRNQISIPNEFKARISRILLLELAENISTFELHHTPLKAINITLFHGTNFSPSIVEKPEFKTFENTPSTVKYAAVQYPRDPWGFLRRVASHISELSVEQEFKIFDDTPSTIRYAAIYHTRDPRGFLRQVITDIEAMSTEPEFETLRKTPGIFKRAAINNPDKPRLLLREVMNGTREAAFPHKRIGIREP